MNRTRDLLITRAICNFSSAFRNFNKWLSNAVYRGSIFYVLLLSLGFIRHIKPQINPKNKPHTRTICKDLEIFAAV